MENMKNKNKNFSKLKQNSDKSKSYKRNEEKNYVEIHTLNTKTTSEFLARLERSINSNRMHESKEHLDLLSFDKIKLDKYKFFVRPYDQLPPRFYVELNGKESAHSIETGVPFKNISEYEGFYKIIQNYWKCDRIEIANKWNLTRPSSALYQIILVPYNWRH